MGEEYHARCDYCGATKSHRWIKRLNGLYCSVDCLLAGNVWGFACIFSLIVLLNFFFLTIPSANAFPVILGFSALALIFLLLVSMGIKAKKRIKRRPAI